MRLGKPLEPGQWKWSLAVYALLSLHLLCTYSSAFVRVQPQEVVSSRLAPSVTWHTTAPHSSLVRAASGAAPKVAAATELAAATAADEGKEPYDVAVVGLGVGGHAACLHAKAMGLRVAAVSGGDPGGTCVNRGCIPSKALLAAARRVRMLQHRKLLQAMGVDVPDGAVKLDPRRTGKYALDIAAKVRSGLLGSLAAHKIPVIDAKATVEAPGVLRLSRTPTSPADVPSVLRARNIILAPGSTPFVPPGIEMLPDDQRQTEGRLYEQQQQVMTSDTAVGLPLMPSYITIVGAGYIGMEFADVFTAMGAEVTLIEAGDRLLPGVDPAIAQAAERILLQRDGEKPIKLLTNTLAASVRRTQPISEKTDPAPLEVQLKDAKTGESKGVLFPDACLVATGRKPASQGLGLEALGVTLKRGGFVPVDACMRVVKASGAPQDLNSEEAQGEVIDGLYCIGDANGLLQLAHAASAQAATAVESILGRNRPFNRRLIPAACFTNPEIAFVGYTEPEAQELAARKGFEVGVGTSNFRANSKALAEGEAEGIMKVLWRKDTGQLLGCHMIGPHAGDLMQQCANAMATNTPVQRLAQITHTHPTLSETVEAAWKQAVGLLSH